MLNLRYTALRVISVCDMCQERNLFVSLSGLECSLLKSGEDVKVRCFLFRPRCIVPYE